MSIRPARPAASIALCPVSVTSRSQHGLSSSSSRTPDRRAGCPSWRTTGARAPGTCPPACAATLPGLVFAACLFASLGPYGEPGLDFLDGLSEGGRDEVRLFFDDRAHARANFRADAARRFERMSTPAGWLEKWGDKAETNAAHGRELAEHLALCWHDGMRHGDQGWWDDWTAFLQPWGFDIGAIRVPVQLWHGARDTAVRPAHGRWLADRIPAADAHFPEA